MQNRLIYLACPYTGNEDKNFDIINRISAKFFDNNIQVFSPISHSHLIAKYTKKFTKWVDFDLQILQFCDKLYVIKLDKWKESEGIKREIFYAKNNKIPITYISGECALL